jgi:hypothetical protein
MVFPMFEYQTALPLPRPGDVNLLGFSPASERIYVEQMYGDVGWVAQYALNLKGELVAFVAEDEGGSDLAPLILPPDLERPEPGWQTMFLNFAGPRHRGLYGLERVLDMVRSLSIEEKMGLLKTFNIPAAMPPLVIGLAESYVLAEARLETPDLFVVCRRLRVAYRLNEEQTDTDGQPYDYDTSVIYLTHLVDRSLDYEMTLLDPRFQLPGPALIRPMDCLIFDDLLMVPDAGTDDQSAAIHLWKIVYPEGSRPVVPTIEQKLYG